MIDPKVIGEDKKRQEFFSNLESLFSYEDLSNTFEILLGHIKAMRSESFKNGYKRGEQDGRDARQIDIDLAGETLGTS